MLVGFSEDENVKFCIIFNKGRITLAGAHVEYKAMGCFLAELSLPAAYSGQNTGRNISIPGVLHVARK